MVEVLDSRYNAEWMDYSGEHQEELWKAHANLVEDLIGGGPGGSGGRPTGIRRTSEEAEAAPWSGLDLGGVRIG